MTVNDIRATIEQRIAAEMANAPPYPVHWGNAPFNPPNNSPWLDVALRFGDDAYATMTSFNRQNGVLVVNIYAPIGAGAAVAFDIAARIKALFSRVNTGGIIFQAGNGPSQVLPASPEAYYQTQVIIPFEAYQ